MNLPQGFTLENNVKPPLGFELTAEGSDLPPFDITISADSDPVEEAKRIVSTGMPSNMKLPSGFSMVNDSTIPGTGIVHTVRAMAETGAGLATGMIAFPVSQLRGLWEYAITLGDKEAATVAEEAWAKAIQFEPTTKEAQDVMQTVSIAIGPIFNTLKQMGESSPVGYPGGVAAQFGGAALLGKAGRAVKGEIGTFGKRPIEAKPVEIPVEKVSAEVTPPEGFTLAESTTAARPSDVKLPEGFKLEEPIKAVETPVVEPPPVEIVQPRANVGAKPLSDMTNQEWQDSRHVLRRLVESTDKPDVKAWAEAELSKYAKTHEEQVRFSKPGATAGGKTDILWYQGQRATKTGAFEGKTDAFFTKDPVEAEWYAGGLSINPKDRMSGGRVIAVRQSELEKRLGRSVGDEEIISDIYPTAMKESIPIDSVIKTDVPALSEKTKLRNPITGAPLKAPKPVATPGGKQPWEMSRSEFAENQGKDSPYVQQQRDAIVKQAIKRGDPVPPEVLPELLPKDKGPGTAGMFEEPLVQGKESKLAIRAEADAIKAKLTEDFGDLVEYKTMNMTDQANRAAEVMGADYEAAKRMAMGTEKPPEGIREATMYEAVKIRAIAEGDVETLQKLATESAIPTRLSEYGQAIKAADSRIMEDPVKVMQDVAKTRTEKVQKVTGVKAVAPDAVAKLSQRVADLEKALAERQVSKTIERIKNDVAREQRQIKRTVAKEELSAKFDGLVKELNSVLGGQLNVGVDPMAAVILGKMAKNRVQSGIITVEALVDSIYTAVKNMGIELSKRDIMDAISGYGKYKQLSKDEIMVQLRDLKGQMQQISKLEDLQNRQPPLKTGIERRIPSNEERRLIKLVGEAKKKYGIQTVDPETQLKSSLDAIKIRLTNQIADITNEIESGIKTVKTKRVQYDTKANELKKQRDLLATVRDALVESPAEMVIEKPGTIPVKKKREISAEQRVNMAIRVAERAAGAYAREVLGQIKKKAVSAIETPELINARNIANEWKERVKELRQVAGRSPEQSLKSLKTRLTNEARKLSDKLDNLDFSVKEKRAIDLDPEAVKLKAARDQAKENYNAAVQATGTVTKEEAARIVELSKAIADAKAAMEQGGDRFTYGAARVAFENYVNDLKGANAPLKTQLKTRWQEAKTTWDENKAKAVTSLIKDTIVAISDNSVSFVAAVDNSFLGRQGLNTLMTHPSIWYPAAKRSFSDIYKTMISKHGGAEVKDAVMADAYSRPNFINGNYVTAKLIPKTEEQFPATLAERLPLGAGRVFKASENAFVNSAIRMRINMFDLLYDVAKKNGVDVNDKLQIQNMGKLINSVTARGDLGRLGEGGIVRMILWAPKMLKGNWDVLTAHSFGSGLDTAFARRQAATNLAKIVGETAAIVAVLNAIKPGSVETNPLSSDFLKYKSGNTRFDFTGGKGSIITLLARAITFKSKSSATGKTTELSSGKYGAKTVFDVGIDFLTNKTTPIARQVVNIAKGRDFTGKKPTAGSVIYGLTTPISIQNFVRNFYGPDKDGSVAAVVGSVVDLVGINANTYDIKKKYRR